jgi:hypothetical protein
MHIKMQVEEYLLMCFMFSIVFVAHSVIAIRAKQIDDAIAAAAVAVLPMAARGVRSMLNVRINVAAPRQA